MLQTVIRIRVVRLHDVPPAFFDVSMGTATKVLARAKVEKEKPFRVYIVRTSYKQKPRYTPEKKVNDYINQ